jgi:hypothetical protein
VDEYLATQRSSDAAQFKGERFSALYEATGRGLIRRIVADARSEQLCGGKLGNDGGWVMLKIKQK